MIKKILTSTKQNYLCTIAIGKKYQDNFEKYSYKNFYKYCKKNDIGLILITSDLIDKSSTHWKKAEWQKLIAPKIIKQKYKKIKNICMIDTDILINTEAPNIFNFHKNNTVSVVSVRKHMPYTWEDSTKKIAFLRNKFYDKKYPLDSAIHISLENLYKFHNFKVQKDEFCAGVYIVSAKHFDQFSDFFYKYTKIVKSITGGGEQTHFNYFIQQNFKINLLNYKFQAMWVYEMSNFYPFLYKKEFRKNPRLIAGCIDSSLINNYFLHFAGSWHEGDMWKNTKINKTFTKKFNEDLTKYNQEELKGKPLGKILP